MQPRRDTPSAIARIASALLMIEGALIALVFGAIFLTGRPAGLEPNGFEGPIVPDNTAAAFVVILFFVGLVVLMVGVFAFLGREWARWMGVVAATILAIPGLVALVDWFAAVPLLLAVVNALIAVALGAAWRQRAYS